MEQRKQDINKLNQEIKTNEEVIKALRGMQTIAVSKATDNEQEIREMRERLEREKEITTIMAKENIKMREKIKLMEEKIKCKQKHYEDRGKELENMNIETQKITNEMEKQKQNWDREKETKNQRIKTKTRENIIRKTRNRTESSELKIWKKSNDNDWTETSNRGTTEKQCKISY